MLVSNSLPPHTHTHTQWKQKEEEDLVTWAWRVHLNLSLKCKQTLNIFCSFGTQCQLVIDATVEYGKARLGLSKEDYSL